MKSTDLRNLTWQQVQEHVGDDMLRVHAAWLAHGPGTTRQIAERSGISLLTLRPRTTDLLKLGMVECTGCEGNQGIYCYVSPDRAEAAGKWRQAPEQKSERVTAGPPMTSRRRAAVDGAPSRDAVSHAASIMARARATRRGHASSAPTFQTELFSA